MTRRTPFVLLAGAAVAALISAFLTAGGDDLLALDSGSAPTGATGGNTPIAAALDGSARGGGPGRAETRESLDPAGARGSQDATQDPSGGPRTWYGSITVFDDEGAPRPPADGRIHVAETPGRPIFVQRGRWKRMARSGSELTVTGIEIGDARALARAPHIVFEGDSPTLEADLAYAGELHVVDSETGLHLDEVQLCIAQGSVSTQSPFPTFAALDRPLINDGASPFVVPDTPGVHTYWAHAPGYAWRAFSFSGTGGARTIALEPGGDVRVTLAGAAPIDGRLDVHIEDAKGEAMHRRVAVGSGLFLTGLPVKDLQAAVIVRQFAGPDKRIATVPFRVRAGALAEVKIDFDEQPELPDYGSLEVLLSMVVPTPLPLEVLRLERIGAGGDTVDRYTVDAEALEELLSGHSYSTRVHGLVPGTWRLDTWPFGTSETFEVAPGEHVLLERLLPTLTQLVVWPRDAALATPIRADEIAWRPVGEEREWQTDKAVAGTDHWILRPTVGTVEISVTRDGYQSVVREIDCAPGSNDVAIDMEPIAHCEVEVSVAIEDAEFPVTPEFWTQAQFAGPGKAVSLQLTGFTPGSRSTHVASATFKVDAPGRYAVRFPEVEGYTQELAGTVDAASGRTARLRIELRPDR